ncbi:hypothetical protein SCHPADRAFT_440242 [Schizopora paradoxa]|uniref:DUF6534 domain-containing protein n=1 Tax=Schizopora paradoxa TaxID=27342 RepID=A0A0H2RKB1_9AGAM|nr:hypothetical protein SCHPADRAFT_440242 [Schizopora paradoxa]
MTTLGRHILPKLPLRWLLRPHCGDTYSTSGFIACGARLAWYIYVHDQQYRRPVESGNDTLVLSGPRFDRGLDHRDSSHSLYTKDLVFEQQKSTCYWCSGLSVGSFAVSMYSGIRVLNLSTFKLVDGQPWILYATAGCDLLADSTIACTLCYYLYRSSTGYKKTSTLLHTIALYVIGTGCVTALWDVMEMIMFATLSDTIMFGVFYLSLSKLYTNALLASLNARPMLHKKLENKSSYLKSFGSTEVKNSQKTRERAHDALETGVELQSTVIAIGLNGQNGDHYTFTTDDTATQSSEKTVPI